MKIGFGAACLVAFAALAFLGATADAAPLASRPALHPSGGLVQPASHSSVHHYRRHHAKYHHHRYGKYHYKSASGREGDWFLIGLSAGKNSYSLHICAGDKDGYLAERNAAKLGKVKTGRSCINFKKLEDLKLDVAMGLVKQAAKSGGINAVV